MNRSSHFYYIIPFFIALALFGLDRVGMMEWVRTIADYPLVPIKSALFQTSRGVWDIGQGFVSFGSLKQQQTETELKLAGVIYDKVELERLRRENEILTKQLSNKTSPSVLFILGHIIGMQGDQMTLDVGSSDAIQQGMAVVIEHNLIGIVTSVFEHSSLVQLPTSRESKIPVQTNSGARGLATGQGNTVILEKVSSSDVLQKDETVITSGSDKIPQGLVVGITGEVVFQEQDLFKSAPLIPLVSVDNLSTLFVLKK